MLFYGTYFALLGFMLPQIKADFNVSYTTSGLIFLLSLLPGIIGNIFAGYLFSKFNNKIILVIASAIIVSFYIILPMSKVYSHFLIINLC